MNSKYFGVPQQRKRIYIVGSFGDKISLDNFPVVERNLSNILERGKPTSKSRFIQNLLSKYAISDLYGKSIKDKRGGKSNIHSWDLEMKGSVSKEEKKLLNLILTERRKKKC